MPSRKIINEHSAGGVVFRSREKGRTIEWLICKHSGYHKWVLPKGIIENGEATEDTALREVAEETGVRAKIINKITPGVAYKYTKNEVLVDKKVEFFLMEYATGDIKDHSWEMEKVRWATGEKALKLLAFETERRVLKTAISIIEI
ncbi:NUDIX domain-containing protein [Candidatus Collierbacteria bacterium]|nr:NUDIX domain-containing protein [Candidatus Collierbacteria bacterium]